MNNNLELVITYFLNNQNIYGLSLPRLIKLIYLADWFSCLIQGYQITNEEWVFDEYGPNSKNIRNTITTSRYFSLNLNVASRQRQIYLNYFRPINSTLNSLEIRILNMVLERTNNIPYKDLLGYVYSTYPVIKPEREFELNLVKSATQYHSDQ